MPSENSMSRSMLAFTAALFLLSITSCATATGGLSGTLSYPSDFAIPAQRVCAFVTTDLAISRCIETKEGDSEFRLNDLTEGSYYVVAYVGDLAGAYSRAVPCGLAVDCVDRTLIPVNVSRGRFTTGVQPADWYAPPGTYPADPRGNASSPAYPNKNSGG